MSYTASKLFGNKNSKGAKFVDLCGDVGDESHVSCAFHRNCK